MKLIYVQKLMDLVSNSTSTPKHVFLSLLTIQLLTSSTFAYSYGICGPMWYGATGSFQILLFAIIAIRIKANAPGAHTFPEIVLARHGKVAHITYLFNGLATNMLVGACLVLGGSQVSQHLPK